MWDPYAEFESAVLPNGLTVHVAHWPDRPWQHMGFVIHAGAENDPVGREGLSHFLEHMVSANTILPKEDLRAFFRDHGGEGVLGITGHYYTKYRFFVPMIEGVVGQALSFFGHMLLLANIENFVERERSVITNEFHRSYPLRFKLELDLAEHLALYRGYWLERLAGPLGTLESIGSISQAELQKHYDTYYTPRNMDVVCVGGMSLAEVLDALDKSPFATEKEGKRTPLPRPASEAVPLLENRQVCQLSDHIKTPPKTWGYHSVAKIPAQIDRRVILILRDMLQESLHLEVRDKRGWAYSIGSSRYNYRHFYEFSFGSGVMDPTSIEEGEEVIEDCLRSLGEDADLLEQIRQRNINEHKMTDSSARTICLDSMSDLAEEHRIITEDETITHLERVSMADIQGALSWLHPRYRWTLITKP